MTHATPTELLAEAIMELEPTLTRSQALRMAEHYFRTKGAN